MKHKLGNYGNVARIFLFSLLLSALLIDLCDSHKAKSKSRRNPHRNKNKGRHSNRVATSYPLQSLYTQNELPKIRMHVKINSGNKLATGRDRRLILDAENSVLVVGEDIPRKGNVVLECSAAYPVQWKYVGEGYPSFEVNMSAIEPPNPTLQRDSMELHQPSSGHIRNENPDSFLAYSFASLGLGANLSEHNTGNYTCQHLLHKEIVSFVYIYVPGPNLFVSPKKETFTRLPAEKHHPMDISVSTVRIPCSTTHPKITVYLQKAVNGVMMPCPLPTNKTIRYSPATGFHLKCAKECDVAGTYLCTASHNDTVQILKHTIFPHKDFSGVQMIEPAMSFHENKEKHKNMSMSNPMKYKHPCKTFTCGHNARCVEINKEPICHCFERFTGDPYKECRHIHSAFFFQTDDPCSPEIRKEICGPHSNCKNVDGFAVCSCHKHYTGNPPSCRSLSCSSNGDCPVDQFCYDKKCEDPCPGACGLNSICSVDNHVPSCTCKNGYDGDPFTVCCLPDDSGEYPCRPKHCVKDEECLDAQTCKRGRCKDVCYGAVCGAHAICGVSSDRKPLCVCAEGFTGDPYSSACKELSPDLPPTDSLESTLWYSSDEKEYGLETLCSLKKNFCAVGAECRVIGSVPICKCRPNYIGDPYKACFEEELFTISLEKDDTKNRNLENVTEDPCKEFPYPCGTGADCQIDSGMTLCTCPRNTVGNPLEACKSMHPMPTSPPMIQIIPVGYPFRIPISVSSLIRATGHHAHGYSSSKGHSHSTNNGNTSKKSSNRSNPCNPSPCGSHSKCTLFNNLPLCSCNAGYSWIGSTCQPSPPTTESYFTCFKNSDCPSPSEVCRNHQCGITQYYTKPNAVCEPSPCGPHSTCRVQEETHRPICQCKYPKYGGSPPRCKPQCIVDADCSSGEPESICSKYGECQPGSRY